MTTTQQTLGKTARETAARRTFAIISHPDAGKTTLTEKFLLYGGAIHLAGSVKQRKNKRYATSDWMELERQRGISITTSVLQFEYAERRLNLLDTPGHNDFSEDTYRTLAAVDSAIMLIDSVKGVESQTTKLFEVCRMRNIPIVTFINKMDRDGRPPLELIDEIEITLGIPCAPMNWPVGSGRSFVGVYDRIARELLRFGRVEGGARRVPVTVGALEDADLPDLLGTYGHEQLCDELALLDGAGAGFDRDAFLAGQVTPVFFGSAITNAGIGPFLDRFVDIAPSPRPRTSSRGQVMPDAEEFSAFVFKIQANMDPHHRDRVAFMRICSGRFERGMQAVLQRTGKPMTLARPLLFLAQDRALVEEGYSGDIVGLWDGGQLRIGDTLAEDPSVQFDGIPRFSPEHFVQVRLADPMKRKQLKKGLEQLSEEGAVQLFFDRRRLEREPVLGAVGVLQFEVIQHRLKAEYGVSVRLESLRFEIARWVEGTPFNPDEFEGGERSTCLLDVEERPLILFNSEWALRNAQQDHPHLTFVAAVQPGRAARAAA